MKTIQYLSVIFVGCLSTSQLYATGTTATTATGEKTLFERLGGATAIAKVVDDFTGRAVADPRIAKYFEKTAKSAKRVEKFKKNLRDQICSATGGPCKYTGKDMRGAHKGMAITDADFDALVEDLATSLTTAGVTETDRTALLGALAPMRSSIVETRTH